MEIDVKCRDLIDKLIVLDPDQRLGAKACGGMNKIKQHPFFEGINWGGDMTKMGMRKIVRETEPVELR